MNRDFFKTLIWDIIVAQAIKRLFVAVPFLGWGPIGFVVSSLIKRFAAMAYETSKTMLEFESISFANKEHQKVFDRQFIKLKLLERQGASDQQLDEEIAHAQKALSDFVLYDRVRRSFNS